MEQEYGKSEGYSEGYFSRMPYYMYDDGISYGRTRNVQRDSRGRYSSDGHSYDHADTKEELMHLMDKATNEREREALRMALESMNK